MKILKYILMCNCFFSDLSSSQENETDQKNFVVVHCRHGAGMFSIFNDVLSYYKYYDNGFYAGVEVNFGKEGQYYTESFGENWWSYYCEQSLLGEKTTVKHVIGDCEFALPCDIEMHTSRQEAHDLIQKYIHFKPEITQEIDKFQTENFIGHYVICVHYRGTDKVSEAFPVKYEEVYKSVRGLIKKLKIKKYKIFVATDEQPFLDFMIKNFKKSVCYNPYAYRSNNNSALHYSNYDRYKCGFDAIIDAILLSKGDYLIRMSSNLSLWSTFFNPNIPVLELNQRK